MYDFDELIDRRGSRCIKYDTLQEHFGRSDLNALWVADMDFRTPDFILDALRRRLDHPVLGYPTTGDDYFEIVSRWVAENKEEVYARVGANYQGEGPGALRRIPQKDLDELQAIFDVTGATERIRTVEAASRAKAEEMGMDFDEYTRYTFEYCSPGHFNNE